MNLPGIITIRPDQPDLIERAARVLGTAFTEEPWFVEWVSALDALGASDERKRDVIVADIFGTLITHAPYQAVYALPDFSGVVGGYLASDLKGQSHALLEEQGYRMSLTPLLTDDEAKLLSEKSAQLAPVSNFTWTIDHSQGREHIYFYAWGVDKAKRGTGAFRRLTQPFFDYADAHGITCYLDCFSDSLQSLYEHIGFEVVDTLHAPGVPIYERCMARQPR